MVNSAETLNVDVVMADFDLITQASNGTLLSNPSYDQDKWRKLPANRELDVGEYTKALGVSPVPWRKLYSFEMIEEYGLRFLE